MIVTAYNNGAHHKSGAGYGVRLRKTDRDEYFSRGWKSVTIVLPDERVVTVNVNKASFWTDCRELIDRAIGQWLYSEGFAPWPAHKPPKLNLEPLGGRGFALNRGKN